MTAKIREGRVKNTLLYYESLFGRGHSRVSNVIWELRKLKGPVHIENIYWDDLAEGEWAATISDNLRINVLVRDLEEGFKFSQGDTA